MVSLVLQKVIHALLKGIMCTWQDLLETGPRGKNAGGSKERLLSIHDYRPENVR